MLNFLLGVIACVCFFYWAPDLGQVVLHKVTAIVEVLQRP